MKVQLVLTAQSDAEKNFLHQLFATGLLAMSMNTDRENETVEKVVVDLPVREGYLR